MLVHKFYLIEWLGLDSNLFEFDRFEFEFEKRKEKESRKPARAGPIAQPAGHLLSFLSPSPCSAHLPFSWPKGRLRQPFFPFSLSLLGRPLAPAQASSAALSLCSR
jgi:hypothetical protein